MESQSTLGSQLFGKADGSHEAGPSKSSLPQSWWNFIPKSGGNLATNDRCDNKSMTSQAFLLLRSMEHAYHSLATKSDFGGSNAARQRSKKTKRTHY